MADVDFDGFEVARDDYVPARRGRVTRIVNAAGALTSVALIAGLGYWGYRLAVRDVTGIPVVRALEGPARIAPENPGGELAEHRGLAVNTVAAEGEAAAPADRLTLAPAPPELSEEDRPMAGLRPMPRMAAADGPETLEQAALGQTRAPDAAAAALAAELAAGSAPAAAAAPLVDEEVTTAPEIIPAPGAISADIPGVARSPRPAMRPEGDFAAYAITAAVAASLAPEPSLDLDPAALEPGTRLVQLGAFDDEVAARAEWERVAARFGALMEGKARVIQPAEGGGRTFYRLRVEGFADVADARRFCAALLAEDTPCIPAQVR